jgi:hypothetical protein
MDIDGLDPLPSDADRECLAGRLLSVRAFQKTATAEDDAGHSGSGAAFEKVTACDHDHFLPGFSFVGSA